MPLYLFIILSKFALLQMTKVLKKQSSHLVTIFRTNPRIRSLRRRTSLECLEAICATHVLRSKHMAQIVTIGTDIGVASGFGVVVVGGGLWCWCCGSCCVWPGVLL